MPDLLRDRLGDGRMDAPTLVTAMPEPRSIRELPSTSTTTPPSASAAYTGTLEPTPAATVARRRAVRAADFGPGSSVTRARFCGSRYWMSFMMVQSSGS